MMRPPRRRSGSRTAYPTFAAANEQIAPGARCCGGSGPRVLPVDHRRVMLHDMERRLGRWDRRQRAGLAAGVALALALVATVVVVRWAGPSDGRTDADAAELEAAVGGAIAHALEQAERAPPAAAQVYEIILPSLVAVRTDAAVAGGDRGIGGGVVVNRS